MPRERGHLDVGMKVGVRFSKGGAFVGTSRQLELNFLLFRGPKVTQAFHVTNGVEILGERSRYLSSIEWE